MRNITYRDLREGLATYLDAVEHHGESFEITRHGKPSGWLIPPQKDVSAEVSRSEYAQAVNLIVTWIEEGADQREARRRFTAYSKVADSSTKLFGLIESATFDLILAGHPPAIAALEMGFLAQLADHKNWRQRGQLLFEIMAELGRRNVSIGDGSIDDEESDPDEDSDPTDENEDYA